MGNAKRGELENLPKGKLLGLRGAVAQEARVSIEYSLIAAVLIGMFCSYQLSFTVMFMRIGH